MQTVDEMMAKAGYEAAKVGGGNWAWVRLTDDDSVLWICTEEHSLDGDPVAPEWYVGRHVDGGFVQCAEFMVLDDALAVAACIPSPLRQNGPVQLTLPRNEL